MKLAPTIRRDILELRRCLAKLDTSLKLLAPALSAVAARNSIAMERSTGRPRSLSPKARATLVLQGRYMGYMRQLKPRQKAQVRELKKVKGVMAAIQRARALADQ